MKEIFSRKSFKVSLMLFLTIFLLFGTLNVYAQTEEDNEFKVEPAWEETKCAHNFASGLFGEKCKEDNMNSRNGTEFLNGAWTAVTLMVPEITNLPEGASGGQGSIPYDMQRGLLGMAEDAGTTAYAIYPKVNIGEHLAQQWVPGYKDEVTSLYAANSASGHISGYEELMNSGIVDLWTKTLNISYIFFVLVMLVAGFMIMFRHKLGGQTMVTLGTILPKIIISLVLATFSFAIAGLIIDIGGIVTGMAAYILGDGLSLSSISGIKGLMASVLGQDNTNFGYVVKGVIESFGISDLFKTMTSGSPVGLLAIALAVISFVIPVIGGSIGTVAFLILIIILGIIFFGAIKVLITLYKAYFGLLIAVILGPIQITLGAIPGNSNMVGNWIKTVLRNVLVFPVVFFIVNIPNALVNSSVVARFPGKLVYEDPASYDPTAVTAGGVFIALLRVFVLYFAAQAPQFIAAVLPPNTSKGVTEAIGAAKGNLAKIPLIGGMFK
jgi:hypothetical protein